VCVEAFRSGQLAFVDIVDTIGSLLDMHSLNHRDVRSEGDLTVDDVLAADAWARARARNELKDPNR